MGALVWTGITYAMTFGIVLIAFRLFVQDRRETAEDATKPPPSVISR